jgi:hypothetical protein
MDLYVNKGENLPEWLGQYRKITQLHRAVKEVIKASTIHKSYVHVN